MQNATLNLENPRAPKPLLPGSHPNSAQGVGAAAREKGLQRIEGMKIAQSAVQGIGMSTKVIRGTWMNSPNYALAVSILFTRATNQRIMLGTEPGHVLSTSLLYNSLLHDSRFMQVPMSQAAPGDIIIEPTKNHADRYAGIVVDHGRVVSDSSNGVRNNSSLSEIQRHLPPAVLFRYIGVQKCPGYTLATLANSGFNPDEPRVPAGQPGGGQWTSGGAQSGAGGRRTAELHGVHDARRKPSHCGSEHTKSLFERMQRHLAPDGSIIVKPPSDKNGDDNTNPKTPGHAAGEIAKSFLSALIGAIRSIVHPDRESSKPKNAPEMDKERNEAADGTDMTKPKGLGSAAAAAAIITAVEALSEALTGSGKTSEGATSPSAERSSTETGEGALPDAGGPGAAQKLIYEPNPKHPPAGSVAPGEGSVAPAPTNPQEALDHSLSFDANSPARVAVDPKSGEFVIFRPHAPGRYHGYAVTWDQLTQPQKNALIKSGQVNVKGKIL
jgi:hypothetical protein